MWLDGSHARRRYKTQALWAPARAHCAHYECVCPVRSLLTDVPPTAHVHTYLCSMAKLCSLNTLFMHLAANEYGFAMLCLPCCHGPHRTGTQRLERERDKRKTNAHEKMCGHRKCADSCTSLHMCECVYGVLFLLWSSSLLFIWWPRQSVLYIDVFIHT